MNREELIEKAAEAMYAVAFGYEPLAIEPDDKVYWTDFARAALVVFEEARTPTDDEVRLATLAAVKKGAKSDVEAVRNYREAERVIRAAIPHLHRTVQGEGSEPLRLPALIANRTINRAIRDDQVRGWNSTVAIMQAHELIVTAIEFDRSERFRTVQGDAQDLIAEADALVESWDRKGSWSPDSPIGLVMRLAAALRAAAAQGGETR